MLWPVPLAKAAVVTAKIRGGEVKDPIAGPAASIPIAPSEQRRLASDMLWSCVATSPGVGLATRLARELPEEACSRATFVSSRMLANSGAISGDSSLFDHWQRPQLCRVASLHVPSG